MGVYKEISEDGLMVLDKIWRRWRSAKKDDPIDYIDLYTGARIMLEKLTGMEVDISVSEGRRYFKPPAKDRG